MIFNTDLDNALINWIVFKKVSEEEHQEIVSAFIAQGELNPVPLYRGAKNTPIQDAKLTSHPGLSFTEDRLMAEHYSFAFGGEVFSVPPLSVIGLNLQKLGFLPHPEWLVSTKFSRGLLEPYSEIFPNLYMGRETDEDVSMFDSFLTLYSGLPVQPNEFRLEIPDSTIEAIDLNKLNSAVTWGVQHLHENKSLLVRCQLGLNRSGLVTALILTRLGMSTLNAVSLIRDKRSPHALFNASYLGWLLPDKMDN